MTAIKARIFKGIVPRLAPHLLNDESGQVAQNCTLQRGRIDPIRDWSVVQSVGAGTKTVFKWDREVAEWLEFLSDVSIIRSPIYADQYYRLYYTENGALVMKARKDNATTTKSVIFDTPLQLVVANSAEPETVTEYVYYVQTYVDEFGQESPPGPVSDIVMFGDGGTITIDLSAGLPTGIASRRIYRSASGNTTDAFYFLCELTTETEYVDSVPAAQLGEEMPLFENPPAAMEGLILHPNGFAVAFHGKDVFFSEPFLPYAWPSKYRMTVEHNIVGLAISCGNVLVLTDGNPYTIAGSHPEHMTMVRLQVPQSCVSAKGIAQVGQLVIYPSPDGLIAVHCSGECVNITGKYFTRDQWQAIAPETMVAGVHNGRYYAFTSAGSWTFDFADPVEFVTTTTKTASACYFDLADDELYLLDGTTIYKWQGDAGNLMAVWKSKEFRSDRRQVWSCARVVAETYPVTLLLYADGVLCWTRSVPDANSFRIPQLYFGRQCSFKIESSYPVESVYLGSSMAELG